jgi:hypothetical protein
VVLKKSVSRLRARRTVEIHRKLFVGSQADYEQSIRFQGGWKIIHACREPYHREALSYHGRSAPKDHPEYLVAVRGDRLILNLIDANDPAYIPKEIMDRSIAFIHESLEHGRRVLVHCNQGHSRGPSIGLLYLARHTNLLSGLDYSNARDRFLERYPDYDPAPGVRGFLVANWSAYCQGHVRENGDGIDENSEDGTEQEIGASCERS